MSNPLPTGISQAVRDLEQAADSRAEGRHEWACFAAHQAAEKAVKALHQHPGPGSLGPCRCTTAERSACTAWAGSRRPCRDGKGPG